MSEKGYLQRLYEGFVWGDRYWGYLRLGVLLAALLFFLIFLPHWARFLIVPLAAVVLSLLWGAAYVQEIYGLRDYWKGLRYLISALFAFPAPRLSIDKGKKDIPPGAENLVDGIGGPGKLAVRAGNAVLCETPAGPSFAMAAGERLLTRYERVREVLSLEEQQDSIEAVTATTKDGIEVTMRDLRYRYRLYADRKSESQVAYDLNELYPFSLASACKAAYGRGVMESGLVSWNGMMRIVLEGVVTRYISQNMVDKLTAPVYSNGDPRQEIRAAFEDKNLEETLRQLGARLVWVEVGRFEVTDKVVEQWLNTWQEKWIGDEQVSRAYGEAQRLAYRELGRAEAQAEMVMSITSALDDIGPQGDPNEQLRNLILMRTAQILEAMSEQSRLPGGRGEAELDSDE